MTGKQAEAIDLGIVTTGKGKQGPNCKCWLGTWNNPSLSGDEWAKVLEESPDIELAVFQKEVGANGTPHFQDRKSTRLNSSHITRSRMPSSA